MFTHLLFSEAAAAAQPGGLSGFDMLLFMLPLFLIFYWFVILRPQQKREDQQRKKLETLDRNDKVMTVGGIIGTVHSIDKDKSEAVLKVDDNNNTKITFHLTAIHTIFPKDK